MPWILISKYSSLYLTPPPLCVSHAWLDWEAISSWITTACKLLQQVIHTSCGGFLSKVVFFFLFFWLFTKAHTVPSHALTSSVWSECQLIILGFSVAQNTAVESDWAALLSKSEAVQYPIGTRVQVWCWQDISAGQCICSHPSSETLSAPTLHYHNALGSVKRPAVIWKGNYLLWNLLKQTLKYGKKKRAGVSGCL